MMPSKKKPTLKSNGWTEAELCELEKLWFTPMSGTDMAKALGGKRTWAAIHANAARLRERFPPRKELKRKRYEDYIARDLPLGVAAAEECVSVKSFMKYLRINKVEHNYNLERQYEKGPADKKREARLRKYAADGLNAEQVSDIEGLSPQRIRAIISYHNLPKLAPMQRGIRKKPASNQFTDLDGLRRCIGEGLTAEQTVAKIGFSESTLKRYAKDMGLKFTPKPKVQRRLVTNPAMGKDKVVSFIPKGEALVLKKDGKFLHWGGEVLTDEEIYKWRGSFKQYQNIIKKCPIKGLVAMTEKATANFPPRIKENT